MVNIKATVRIKTKAESTLFTSALQRKSKRPILRFIVYLLNTNYLCIH